MFCLQVLFNILFNSGSKSCLEYKLSSLQRRTIHHELDGTVWAEQLYVLCVIQEYVFTSWQWQTLLWTPQSQVSALNSLPGKCNSILNCARFEGWRLFALKIVLLFKICCPHHQPAFRTLCPAEQGLGRLALGVPITPGSRWSKSPQSINSLVGTAMLLVFRLKTTD